MLIEIMKKIALACLIILFFQSTHAIEPFIITDIRVEGIERLEPGTVFNYLPLKVGDELNDEEAQLSIKELFRTGFFKDVVLKKDGAVLVVKVVERPSIANMTVNGNKALETEIIYSGLEQAGMIQGRIFNSTALDQIEQEIKNMYLAMGRYSATVKSAVQELSSNRVSINLDINEGQVARIRNINIIGTEAFSVKDIKDEMRLKDKRGFRLFTRQDQYSKQRLEADIESIRSFYLDQGYHDFKITSTNVQISPNKQNIFLSISLEEGDLYTFVESTIEGVDEAKVAELQKLIEIKPGEPFSRKAASQSRGAIAYKYADNGYAFAKVRLVFNTNKENNTVNTVFTIVPNQRVYVRRIDITGNTNTHDEVIRRELRQFEGAWYSASAVNRSKDRLQRLGFFESVKIETPTVPNTMDQVDMNVIVKERDTGSIQFSVGYSDADGALLGAGYQQRNLLGTSKDLSVDINTSESARTAAVSYTNPYYTEDGISRTIKLTSRNIDAEQLNTAEYLLNTNKAGLIYRIPIAETNFLNLGVTYEQLNLEATAETPPEILSEIYQRPDGDNLVLTLGISKNTQDDFFFPTSGANSSIYLEASVPGSDFEYHKINLQSSYYLPLSEDLTIKGSLGLGYMYAYGDDKELGLPFFKNYFAGGANSVRGYRGRSLGIRDSGTTPQPLGGDKRVLANLELLFPPYGDVDSTDRRIGMFIDAGMVYGNMEDINLDELRYSTGFVYNWFSPLGPFSISYGIPINEELGDEKEELQITFGTIFR